MALLLSSLSAFTASSQITCLFYFLSTFIQLQSLDWVISLSYWWTNDRPSQATRLLSHWLSGYGGYNLAYRQHFLFLSLSLISFFQFGNTLGSLHQTGLRLSQPSWVHLPFWLFNVYSRPSGYGQTVTPLNLLMAFTTLSNYSLSWSLHILSTIALKFPAYGLIFDSFHFDRHYPSGVCSNFSHQAYCLIFFSSRLSHIKLYSHSSMFFLRLLAQLTMDNQVLTHPYPYSSSRQLHIHTT